MIDFSPLAQRVSQWALRRARERSTWAGLAMIATALGDTALAGHISQAGDVALVVLGSGGAALAAATTSQHPTAPVAPTDPAKTSSALPSMEIIMSFISLARKVFGIVAVAVAPTWNKSIANALAQAEATLVPLLGDDAKRLCADATSTTATGFQKLALVVADLAKIAADKGIKADGMVLTVIAAKAYAQVKADAPELLDAAIETGITAAAGPVAGALAAPVVEAGVAAATGTPAPATA